MQAMADVASDWGSLTAGSAAGAPPSVEAVLRRAYAYVEARTLSYWDVVRVACQRARLVGLHTSRPRFARLVASHRLAPDAQRLLNAMKNGPRDFDVEAEAQRLLPRLLDLV